MDRPAGAGVALTTIVAAECLRVLFRVAYHTGESAGWTKAGLGVVVLVVLRHSACRFVG